MVYSSCEAGLMKDLVLAAESIKDRDARIAELERVLKSVAAYVEECEGYCFNAEEDLGRNPCGFCVAAREIKTVMEAK